MRQPYRHYWLALIGLLLIAPMLGTLHDNAGEEVAQQEFRKLAAWPSPPQSISDLKKLPKSVDAYLMDHFGFRQTILGAHAWITDKLGKAGNTRVLLGYNGWMFYRGDRMLEQSSGQLIRPERIAELAAHLYGFGRALETRGIKLMVAFPPNSATIYGDQIPGWPQMTGRRTEYGLTIDALRERSVPVIDLRPVLLAARSEAPVYFKHDTHWTPAGAVVAFNAIAAAAGHASWHLEPATALQPQTLIRGGDLARMLRRERTVSELVPGLLPVLLDGDGMRRQIKADPAVFEHVPANRRTRPQTVLVLGDSFTEQMLPHLLAASGVRALWTSHRGCGVPMSLIDQLRPDEVWYMPNERSLLCTRATHNAN
jgi:alginate O-acetyltransferase complex protein AlgJ